MCFIEFETFWLSVSGVYERELHYTTVRAKHIELIEQYALVLTEGTLV